MRKRYLRSDSSEYEARFFTAGAFFVGSGNKITGLFRLVGMFFELQNNNRSSEIFAYHPDADCLFKYENKGYTIINHELKKKGYLIARKYLRNLSRKWSLQSVVLSFDSHIILSELVTYIAGNDELRAACIAYLQTNIISWDFLMPIQFDFLGTRFNDRHKDWKIAEKIILVLSTEIGNIE